MTPGGMVELDQDVTDPAHGTPPGERTVEQLLDYGLVLLDKPPGPTSHEAAAWARRLLGIEKAGHSGTLDPQVSGVLPLGLGEATKALGVLLLGTKEYHALGRMHVLPPRGRLEAAAAEFTGPIYQRPPQRSAVSRRTRVRTVHELEVLELRERLVLARVVCESGTYVRKLFYDIGEVLGPGATMVELRRTRVAHFAESGGLVTLHELANAAALWRGGDGSRLAGMIRPVEEALSGIKAAVIRDSAVDALCHGAQLAVPGVLQVTGGIARGDLAAVYTQKGEAVALAEARMSEREMREAPRGQAFETRRIIMAPGTYPRRWRTRPARGEGRGSG